MKNSALYTLPWKATDNPNGWIEPTTVCNLRCPGCYRGCDQSNHMGEHLPLEQVKKQIDWHIENRNIQTLSVAGGEPMLYPELEALTSYARSKMLRVMIYTNGTTLSRENVSRLTQLGVTQFLVHVDEFQDRPDFPQEDALEIRKKFCRLFEQVPEAGLGFIQPLSPESLENIGKLTQFYSQNRHMIRLVVFTLYREIHWEHQQKPAIDTQLTMQEAIKKLEAVGFIKPASYLPGTENEQQPAWVFSYSIGRKNKISGFLSAKAYQKIQERYKNRNGRFLFITRQHIVRWTGLFKLIFFPGILNVLIKNPPFGVTLFFQTSLLIRGPLKHDGGWHLCRGCPDAMLHNGKLVPSCILEEIKANTGETRFVQ